jgi:nicotinamidase-related amidase
MKKGLILVDIQNDYFPGGRMELVNMQKAALGARGVLDFFRKNHWPTFHIQHVSLGPQASFFLPDTDGVKIHETIAPSSQERVIQKHYPNSFRETSLLEDLKGADVRDVTICGAMSHLCIDATTRAAADFGFRCTVVHDACATRDLKFQGNTIPAAEVHGAFMGALQMAYARVVGRDAILS